jgi:uncharacterized protein (DUF885 family)
MKRIFLLSLFVLLLIIVSLSGAETDFGRLAENVLAEIWSFYPVHATFKGIHEYDTLLADYTRSSLERRAKEVARWLAVLDTIDTLALTDDDRIDYRLLRIHLDSELFNIDTLRSYERDPLIYVSECIEGIYVLLLRSSPSTRLLVNALRARSRRVPAFLDVAKINLKHPPRINCEIGIEQLEEAEDLIEEVYTAFRDSLAEDERKEFQLEKNKAIASMWVFADWLKKAADPDASPVLGRAHYEHTLRNFHLIDMDAESLLRLGEHALEAANRMIDSLEDLREESPPETVDVPEGFDKRHVMAYRQQEIAFIREYVAAAGLVTVPDWIGRLEVVETPGFLRTIIPGIAMMPPGPFDDSATSFFYVNPLPVVFNHDQTEYYLSYIRKRWFRGSVVHEGYPGHHLQLSIANRHPSDVRKSFHDNFLIEGWALYCEEMMARTTLYEDSLDARIAALYGVKFRAARVVVDCMLQTGQFTYEQAVSFMRETLGGDSTYLAREVRRYLTDPCQASSYLVGKLQILDLRDEYAKLMGDRFDLKEFHDRLLQQGSIPVVLIRNKLLKEALQERTHMK